MAMSKPGNMFAIGHLRRDREMSDALQAACKHIVADCARCPLHNTERCAESQLPPAGLGDDKLSYCEDWLFLHFWGSAGTGSQVDQGTEWDER